MTKINSSYDLLVFLKEKNLLEGHLEYWWPNENNFEIFLGSILTQNTKWENVEKSLHNLRQKNLLSLKAIEQVDLDIFIEAITASGFKNQKAVRIKKIASNILDEFKTFEYFCKNVSRQWLLNQKGIGQETADAILSYACKQDVLVVDKYTQKFVCLFGYDFKTYEELQAWCEYGIKDNYDKILKLYGYEISLNKLYCRFHGKVIEYMKRKNKHFDKGKK